MVLRKLAVALLSVGVMLPGLGHALAVKDVQTKSALGEPFQAEVELSELGDLNADEIKVSLATQEDFERLGIERVYFLTDLRFDVVVNPAGRSFVKITTDKPVREPYLDFVVRIAWPGNTRLQEVTALLDPPVVTGSEAPDVNQAVASAPVAPVATPAAAPADSAAPAQPAATVQAAEPPKPVVTAPAPVANTKKSSPAQPAPVPSVSADSYRTQAGDTMSKVGGQFRPDSASLAQTMVAIQRANPKAFANSNLNLLKRGQVLRIPSESEIREVSAQEAVASVREQGETWRGAAAATVAKPALEGQQVNATAKAPAPAPAAPVEAKPEMKLLGGKTGKAGAAAAGKEQGGVPAAADSKKLDANKAKVEATKAEKSKLADKVGTLDAQVKANDKQIEVQNAKMAELQAKLKEQAEKEAAAKAAAAAAPAPAAAPAVAAAAPAADAAKPADAAAPAATPEGVQTQAAPTTPVESKPLPPQKPAVVQEEPAPEEGLPLGLIGAAGAGVLALLGGFLWNRKRIRDKQEEAEALAELEAMDNVGTMDAGDGSPDSLFFGGDPRQAPAQADDAWLGESSEPAALAPAQDRVLADPLEEVEQYIAFERYPQAVGFLNKAISANPDRADLRMKLLEIYARLDDYNGFVEQEAWFENAGDLQALAHAEELKAGLTKPKRAPSRDDAIVFEKPVLGSSSDDDLPSLEDLEMDFNATVSASSPALQAVKDSDLDLPSLDDDFSLDTRFDAPATSSKAADSGLSLDEELDMSFTEPDHKPAKAAALDDDLSFELDEGAFDSKSATLDLSSAAADEGLDFSLDEPQSSGKPASMSLGDLADFDATPELKEPEVQTSDDDLSFSLDDLEVASTPAHADLDGDFSLDDGKGGSDFSFDETLQADSGLNDVAADFDSTLRAEAHAPAPKPAATTAAAPAPAAAATADLGMDDEFDFLADTDENATKLDLARAYIDMGDMEGARDILQEVLTEGSSTQKDEAKGLLAQVG